MKIVSYLFFGSSWHKMLSKSLFLGALASVGMASSAFSLSDKAEAQTPTEIRNFAKAVLEMEPERRQAFAEIKKMIGGREIPQIVCNDSNSLSTLPNKVRDIAVNYCNRSQQIVEKNGLTIDNFNRITKDSQNNADLKQKIYNTLLDEQKNHNTVK